MPLLSIKEETFPAGDKIDLVSSVRLLRILIDRRVKLHRQRAMRKDGNGQIARWGRTFRHSRFQSHVDAL